MKLRAYQREAVDSIYEYFSDSDGNPIVVAPTGSGKSVMIAKFSQEILESWANQRILVLTHVRELILQNFEKLKGIWQEAPAGIYSASVGRRDTQSAIIFAGVQSVFNKAYSIGWFDLILVDECHLIPPGVEGRYNQLLNDLRKINHKLKVIGFSATPYRMKSGHLIGGDNALFTDICYQIEIKTLIEMGHLCPVIPKRMDTDFHMENVRTHGGEYSLKDMQKKMDVQELTESAVKEIVQYGANRRSWLIFCSGVDHAFHVRDEIRRQGYTCETITGKTPKLERSRIIADYKSGRLKALTNADVLTTGFDAPATDLLAVLRGTKSPGLWVQIVGRGMRISPETQKENCLVLDFGRNTAEHGPIDQITMAPRKKGKKKQSAPVKACPSCKTEMLAIIRQCEICGYEFPLSEMPKFTDSADERELLSFEGQPIEVEINRLFFRKHTKPGKPSSLAVSYYKGIREVAREWVFLEYSGIPRVKAVNWWRLWVNPNTPKTVDEAMELLGNSIDLPSPVKIKVKKTGKYPEVVGYDLKTVAA